MKSSQSKVIERLQQAQNAQDLEAFLACFAPNFQSEHPLHPERAIQGIQGVEHVRKNWSTVFHNIPDFTQSYFVRQLRVIRSGLSGTGAAPVATALGMVCAE
ncbi:MAG: nuclear transport factor 2 family protein [Chroococcidiopsidaceae cyanobacterium CP_BM_ER_R8_30]|nr:nuclear transport factor 2 family protein [Chroococcidiopsidaceae cyanobacterium CP_BM_ER_R8_30]